MYLKKAAALIPPPGRRQTMLYNPDEIIKLCGGKVELAAAYVEKIYTEGKRWFAQFRTVYQLNYSENAGFYTEKVLYLSKYESYVPITKAGYFTCGDGDYMSRLTEKPGFFHNF